MQRTFWIYFLLLGLFLTACAPAPTSSGSAPPLEVVTLNDTVKIVTGQTVYAPVYSQIYTWEQNRSMNLTATLSVRNTDLTHPIILASVKYYGSDGKLVRNYLEQPSKLGPMASTHFVVNQEDTAGGPGPAFLVEWVAQQQSTEPVVEAVMISAVGNQGISFVSPGRVIKRLPPNTPPNH